MGGITILHTYNEVVLDSIMFFVLGAASLWLGILIFKDVRGYEKLFSTPAFAFSVLFFFCMVTSIVSPIQYAEIMIDEDVPYSVVERRYEIKSKRGDIYTAIVRDDE